MSENEWAGDEQDFLRLFLRRWENMCADQSHCLLMRALSAWQAMVKAEKMAEREARLTALRVRCRETLLALDTAPTDAEEGLPRQAVLDLLEWTHSTGVFKGLADEHLEQIAHALRLRILAPREVVFLQGQSGDDYYVVFDGAIDLFDNFDNQSALLSACQADGPSRLSARVREHDEEGTLHQILGTCIHTLSRSAGFGEVALLSPGGVRACSAVAASQGAALAVVPRAVYNVALLALHQKKMSIAAKATFLRGLPMFKNWRSDQLAQLSYSLKSVSFAKGEHVMREHHDARFMLFIEEGEAHVTQAPLPRHRQSLGGRAGATVGLPAGSGACAVAMAAAAPAAAVGTAGERPPSASQEVEHISSTGKSSVTARRPSFSAEKFKSKAASQPVITATIGAKDFVGAESLLADWDPDEWGGGARLGVFQYGVVVAKTLRAFKLVATDFHILLKGATGKDTMDRIASIVRARGDLRKSKVEAAAMSNPSLTRRASRASLATLGTLPEGAVIEAAASVAQENARGAPPADDSTSSKHAFVRRDSMSKEGAKKLTFRAVPLAEAEATPMQQAHEAVTKAAAEEDRRQRAAALRQEKRHGDPFAGCSVDGVPAPAGTSEPLAEPVIPDARFGVAPGSAMASLSLLHTQLCSQRLGAAPHTSTSLSAASGFNLEFRKTARAAAAQLQAASEK